ncbi:hypothetical protein COT20_01610 [bacterium (Candidatus Gribaldobacteria) CG08_land_8_20_14_0_20_39_15]|uniref:Uncharacterized protein n=1 Tax=bacterium (Candidatus Gribaldobacteria) CG08_land_8_20_14_0_20_39_15 TaxID=2014273 RepID=A0A2M6XUP6_9BACT|nr:MAG: hypothetical protein COT20_01610 [bacterium (Candidatus Gribaldobacteria) CG08_land_8_20_14_0_20_39_15]
MKKFIFIVLIFLLGGIAGYLFFNIQNPTFEKLAPEAMYQRLINERDFAIAKAIERGDYRCCINPPCTMCYMEANQWNNFTAGTCACDDLIAQGKDPCPQCKKGLCPNCKIQSSATN